MDFHHIKTIFILFTLLIVNTLYSKNKDSTSSYFKVKIGTNVMYSQILLGNYRHEISTWLINNSFNVGFDYNYKLTNKKQMKFGLNYYYSDCVLSSGLYYIPFYYNHTKVEFNGLEFSNKYQYQVFKWLNLNAGLSHYFRLSSKVHDKEMGREFKLLKPDNSININTYSIGLLAGAEFMFSKKISAEFNYIRGLNHFYKFDKSEEIIPKYRNQLMILQLTFNYKL